MEPILLQTSEADAGTRLDACLARAIEDLTRSAAAKAVEDGRVLVNGKAPNKSYKLTGHEQIEFTPEEPAPIDAVPQDIPLDVVYEDDDVIVVNKPSGLVVHPAPGHPDGTLVNALLYHCGDSLSGVGGALRPGIVHRIDRDTSGLIIAAKNDYAHQFLSAQLADHTLARTYECIVVGNLREDSGTVDAPIARDSRDRKRMKAYVSACVNPQVIEVMQTYCFASNTELTVVPAKDGRTDLDALKAALGEDAACFYLQQPNYFGQIEDARAIGELVHAAGAKFVMGVNPIACALLPTPREMGADIAVGDGQPLGLDTAFGGPYLGFMAPTAALAAGNEASGDTSGSSTSTAMIYMSYSALNAMAELPIDCYEIVLPDPVSGFAKKLMTEKFPIGSGAIVQNTGRFSVSGLISVIGAFGKRSMTTNGVIYPYWENAARMAESYAALYLLLGTLLAIMPVVCLTIVLVKFITGEVRKGYYKASHAIEDRVEENKRKHYIAGGI